MARLRLEYHAMQVDAHNAALSAPKRSMNVLNTLLAYAIHKYLLCHHYQTHFDTLMPRVDQLECLIPIPPPNQTRYLKYRYHPAQTDKDCLHKRGDRGNLRQKSNAQRECAPR